MEISIAPNARPGAAPQRRATVSARLAALRGADALHALPVLEEIHAEVGVAAAALNARLLGTALQWTGEDKEAAAAMGATQHELARAAYQFTRLIAGVPEEAGAMQRAAAIALNATGDAMKSDAVGGRASPTDYRSLHTLMREAITRSGHRALISLPVGGQPANCTLEALYFRALLLARFAGGGLNAKQIEILDTWIWMWLPALKSTSSPPQGAALRADLDSTAGLTRGARADAGPSLYLPQGPIENAYRSLRRELGNGNIVPAGTLAASFRIEEHVAVLDLIARGLKESRAAPVARAPRSPGGLAVEMCVGLTEIGARGHSAGPVAVGSMPVVARAEVSAAPERRERDRDVALAEIYEPLRRTVRVLDESDSGFAVEGALADCGQVSVRDLVGVRLRADGPLVIGRVARISPSARGRVLIGVKQLSRASREVETFALDEPGATPAALLFLPGAERSGTQDGFLLSEAQFTRNSRIEVAVEEARFILRFNRVRERGRGWILAGFVVVEVLGARRMAHA